MKRLISNLILLIIILAFAGYIRNTNPEKFDRTAKNIYMNIKEESSKLYEAGSSILQDVLISYGSPESNESSSQTVANPVGGFNKTLINKVKGKILNVSGMPSSKYTVSNHEEYYKAIYNTLINYEDSVTIRLNNYDPDIYNLETVNQVIYDHFDIDYGVKSVGATLYSGNKYHAITITLEYAFDRDSMLKMKAATDAKSKQIISKIIKPGMSNIQKELAIHDYVVKNTAYDYDNLKRGTLPEESYTIYGALVNRKAVCEGYAKAMFKLLNMAGIENKVVVGEAEGVPHAWNLVKINGSYTHLDATWDDPVTGTRIGILSHEYFNISDKQISKTHKWDRSKYPKGVSIPK